MGPEIEGHPARLYRPFKYLPSAPNTYMILLSLIAAIFLLITNALDIAVSVKGIRAGVAEEGNLVIRYLFGPKPALISFIIYDGAWFVLLTGLSLSLAAQGNIASALFFGASIGKGLRHLSGYFKWKALGVSL